MDLNIILAGVGGQGILTIARAISIAALRRGLHLKQAEVHGMSQRGGDVQSHLRIADHELFSDLIPLGQADVVLSVEPLESLRYVQYLRSEGVVVTNTNAFVNIDNYPPVEQVLERVSTFPRHVMLDFDGLAKKSGSGRSANIVALGAASQFMSMDPQDLEDAVEEMFKSKGAEVVEANRRAFRIGRNTAAGYREGLSRGVSSRVIRDWIESLDAEQLAAEEGLHLANFSAGGDAVGLSGAESNAFERTLLRAYEEGRKQLYEHEVYRLVELVGAISPPRYVFVPKGGMISSEAMANFPGERVVLKVVSQDIVHKTEAKGVVFVPREYETVRREIDRMVARHSDAGARVEGVLVVEYVERTQAGFGNELFVGVRATREFGPVIAAGLGGVDTEYLATKMKPGIAVAKACAMDITAEAFFDLFQQTAAYDVLSGRARGHDRIVSDGELMRCFRAFISIARRFCIDRGIEGPDIAELEVNPFAFRNQRMAPLDGRGRLGPAHKARAARPIERVSGMLEPKAIAVLGVSSSSMNFGRIILNNVKRCGFPAEHLYIVKENEKEIDGVRCYESIEALPEAIDLLVIAAPAATIPDIVDSVVASKKVGAAIMIPGGMGETEGTEEIKRRTDEAIARAREVENGPVFLGPNCMGIQSRPGRYDTFFIPQSKLDTRWSAPARRVGLISQSGAFIITRLSNIEMLDPAVAISLGNQIDLTHADLLQAVGQRDDIDVIGVYAEGFTDLGGVDFIRAVGQVTEAGKTVVFYKAGRTSSGRSAAAGHTASVAGDYDVCQAAVAQAGGIVVETFKEFEQLLEVATALHGKRVSGRRIGAISNAGYETVGMADNIAGAKFQVEMPGLTEDTKAKLTEVLGNFKLAGLVNARNPLDMTPMANDDAYEAVLRVMLEAPEIDAVVAALVPLTPAMKTTPEELEKGGSLTERLPKLFASYEKPLVACVDCGSLYDPFVRAMREAGVPVFRSGDQAMRSLGRYLCYRSPVPAQAAMDVHDVTGKQGSVAGTAVAVSSGR